MMETIAIFGSTRPTRLTDSFREMFTRLHHLLPRLRMRIHRPFYDFLAAGDTLPAGIDATPFDTFADTDPQLVVSIGGDGTLLSTAAAVAPTGLPVLAINAGHLGYMTAAPLQHAADIIADIAHNGCRTISPRTLINVSSPAIADSNLFALNEVAVLKLNTASMIRVDASVPGAQLASFSADGLIVSTPTGSTGYNLSVGGPIIVPDAPVLVVSPIAPHSLTMRSLVLPDTMPITISATSRSESYLLSIDGRSTELPDSTPVTLTKAPYTLNLVSTMDNPTNLFINTLRSKLLWAADGKQDY